MRPGMAVKYSKVKQVVMDTGNAEAVLILLPETQSGRTADAGQTDLKEGEGQFIISSIHLSVHPS